MVWVEYLCLSLAFVLMLVQAVWACRFALRYRARPQEAAAETALPHATVLLCIRGSDPSLAHCLQGLLHQDYPHYDIRIIIDSADDPAWELVAATLARPNLPPVQLSVLVNRQTTCSLKLSSLVQAISELPASTEIVALIDADVIPQRHWLRDLARPLRDPRVGASSGVRWYMPGGSASWGTLVRAAWNAGACTQMDALRIPWGGSLAFRAELFRRSDLLERWARSFVEDTGSHRVLRSLGLRLCRVPEATMVNHEDVGLRDCFRFMRRQLLCVRLYHESWPTVVAVGLGMPLTLLGTLGLAIAQLRDGNFFGVLGLAALLAGYGVGTVGILAWADRCINRWNQARGAAAYPFCWKLLPAVPLAALTHLSALIAASFLRKVEWRGITYEVHSSGRVRLTEYRPFRRTAKAQETSVM